MPSSTPKLREAIPVSFNQVRGEKRPPTKSEQSVIDDLKEEARLLRLRMIDVEDVMAIVDMLAADYDTCRDAEWKRERVGGYVGQLKSARAAMINRDPPDRARGRK